MKVRIVCYEDIHAWILGKFALKMRENLIKVGVSVDISNVPDLKADINHHINYGGYGSTVSSLDTLMITHIDDTTKLALLKKQMQTAKMGICMSKEAMIILYNLGIPREKLCYINPAHDGVIKARPLVVGITCRVQNDGRKREYMLGKLAETLDPEEFSFKIMGEYWTPYVIKLQNKGFCVEYHEKFDYETYTKLIPSLDYYLYMGQDEGQMGFIDALAAGVKTIVTAQGYHLDAVDGISYPFSTYEELLSAFKLIESSRKKLVSSVAKWNWIDYTKKHVEVWEYLLRKNDIGLGTINNSSYPDGLNTVSEFAASMPSRISYIGKFRLISDLIWKRVMHTYFFRKNKQV